MLENEGIHKASKPWRMEDDVAGKWTYRRRIPSCRQQRMTCQHFEKHVYQVSSLPARLPRRLPEEEEKLRRWAERLSMARKCRAWSFFRGNTNQRVTLLFTLTCTPVLAHCPTQREHGRKPQGPCGPLCHLRRPQTAYHRWNFRVF